LPGGRADVPFAIAERLDRTATAGQHVIHSPNEQLDEQVALLKPAARVAHIR